MDEGPPNARLKPPQGQIYVDRCAVDRAPRDKEPIMKQVSNQGGRHPNPLAHEALWVGRLETWVGTPREKGG